MWASARRHSTGALARMAATVVNVRFTRGLLIASVLGAVAAGYVYHLNFFPTATWGWTTSILALVPTCLVVLYMRRPVEPLAKSQATGRPVSRNEQLLAALIIALVVWSSCWVLICQLGGTYLTNRFGITHTEFALGDKYSIRRSWGCRYYVRIAQRNAYWGTKVCIGWDDYHNFRDPVRLTLDGKISAAGFRVTSYAR
jgi:hypothetical protein